MNDVPLWQTLLGLTGMLVWGVLCGVPALAIYSLAARDRGGLAPWLLLVATLLIWFPLVTVLCVWAYATLIGIRLG